MQSMNKLFRTGMLASLVAVIAPTTRVYGDPTPLFSFGFTDLDGDFDAGTSIFTANATDTLFGGSDGDVTRTVPVDGTALFNDFDAADGSADFTLSMMLSSITSSSASGVGSFTITDEDGDTISGNLSGTWELLGGVFASFEGLLGGVLLTDNGAPDGTFDGPDGGSFSLDFSAFGTEPFSGAILTLSLPDNWFDAGDFDDANTEVIAQVVPLPGAVLLAGLGLGVVAWAKRRLA